MRQQRFLFPEVERKTAGRTRQLWDDLTRIKCCEFVNEPRVYTLKKRIRLLNLTSGY